MAGKWELGFPKRNACSPREQAARTILRNVRSQGHTYVELREDGKKFIFFCTLCLAPCYSDSVLFDHLKGSLHTGRLSAAKTTLLGPNPWPFSDGILFFDNSFENDKSALSNDNHDRFLEHQNNNNCLAIVSYGENLKSNGHGRVKLNESQCNDDGVNCTVLIPGVLIKEEISDIEVRELGNGQIAARFLQEDQVSSGINRIWCEWLGKMDLCHEDKFKVPEHDFAVVTFTYNVDISRYWLRKDVKSLLPLSSPRSELESNECISRKRKALSDPEDISESMRNQYNSSNEGSSASNGSTLGSLLDQYDSQSLQTRFISNKAARRELRRQQRLAAERMCDICQHKMLPGKDVSTLLNMKTGRLACSSRNVNGAFHVFHTSCLIHWLLLCEYEKVTKELGSPKVRRRSRRKTEANKVGKDGEMKVIKLQIGSVFCPECQGTGILTDGDKLEEKTKVSLSEMFKYKIKASDGRRAWMKNPEMLQNCSIGFHFPYQSQETIQEELKPLKLLRFYRAHD